MDIFHELVEKPMTLAEFKILFYLDVEKLREFLNVCKTHCPDLQFVALTNKNSHNYSSFRAAQINVERMSLSEGSASTIISGGNNIMFSDLSVKFNQDTVKVLQDVILPKMGIELSTYEQYLKNCLTYITECLKTSSKEELERPSVFNKPNLSRNIQKDLEDCFTQSLLHNYLAM